MTPKNVTVTVFSGMGYKIEWDGDGAHWHVWRKNGETDGVIYKNPPSYLNRHRLGFLSLATKVHTQTFATVMKEVETRDLLRKADEEFERREQNRQKAQEAEWKAGRIRTAGEPLLELLKRVLNDNTEDVRREAYDFIDGLEL